MQYKETIEARFPGAQIIVEDTKEDECWSIGISRNWYPGFFRAGDPDYETVKYCITADSNSGQVSVYISDAAMEELFRGWLRSRANYEENP